MVRSGETVRITLDIPVEEYLELKIKVAEKRITLRKYFLDLISKERTDKQNRSSS